MDRRGFAVGLLQHKAGQFCILIATCLVWLGTGETAQSCTPAPGWPEDVRLDARLALRTLSEAAPYIDLAVITNVTKDFEYANLGPDANSKDGYRAEDIDGVRYHFRVVEHLKGSGPETFSISGEKPVEPPPGERPQSVSDWSASPEYLNSILGLKDLAFATRASECVHYPFGFVGGTVLVFRGADGYLLRKEVPVEYHGGAYHTQGPVYIPVGSAHNPIVTMVRQALSRPVR
jgi:hypothetical protein